jgi:phytoene dehydrogenase-like protein
MGKTPQRRLRFSKKQLLSKSLSTATQVLDIDIPKPIFSDTFTPITINRFTGHFNGAIYGTPKKNKQGTTNLQGLFICGTDQGFLGITGAMLSGISMANMHILQ